MDSYTNNADNNGDCRCRPHKGLWLDDAACVAAAYDTAYYYAYYAAYFAADYVSEAKYWIKRYEELTK